MTVGHFHHPSAAPRDHCCPVCSALKTAVGDVVDVVWEWVSMTTLVEELKVDSPDRQGRWRATSYFIKDGDLYLELPVNSVTLRFKRQG